MDVLGIFAKHPVPGQVKSRLAAESSPSWAANVADAFVRDLSEKLKSVNAERYLAYAPDHDAARCYFSDLARTYYQLTPQCEGDLGQRLANFISEHLRRGCKRIVIVGSDSPTLPVDFVERAFILLQDNDLVLGPATDGGYYLIGCRVMPSVFSQIAWGSSRVLAQTVTATTGSLALLPPWYDVDTMADWDTLTGHVTAMRRAGQDPQVARTEQLIHASPFQAPNLPTD